MDSPIPERLLRQIWREQCFSNSALCTADGKAIEILSPGSPNSDGGPDFLNARIRIDETIYCGDVELHKEVGEWLDHRHEMDPHYNRIILHVVLTAEKNTAAVRTESGRHIPLLILHPLLDDTLFESLSRSMLTEGESSARPIRCTGLNDVVPAGTILNWIEKLGWERMELKVRRCEERLKQLIDEEKQAVREPYPKYHENPDEIPAPKQDYSRKDFASRKPWERLLYEGIMEALGFAKNRSPFLALARSVRLDLLRRHGLTDTQAMMALLFGVAGLLPSTRTLANPECRSYVRALRKRWKELRPSFTGALLNTGDWLFFRLRPSNFPTARLAALCFSLPTLFGDESFRMLIASFKEQDARKRLHSLFAFEPDEFWKHHYRFEGSTARSRIHLGQSRLNDIIVNVFIPVVILYARVFGDHDLSLKARRLPGVLPPLQQNGITRKIARELVKGKAKANSALLQQGAIQLYRFYCTAGRCTECEVGKMVFAEPAEGNLPQR